MADTSVLKTKLEEEKKLLEEELATVGRRNPDNPKDWEPTQGESELDPTDRNDLADNIEKYEENSEILKELEIRYNNILLALKKLDEGKYGICEVGGEKIEDDRLDANPAARTCKKHINKEQEGEETE